MIKMKSALHRLTLLFGACLCLVAASLGGVFTRLPNYSTTTKGTCGIRPWSYDIYYTGNLNQVNQVALNTSGQTVSVAGSPTRFRLQAVNWSPAKSLGPAA
jgi:hypothetical protein